MVRGLALQKEYFETSTENQLRLPFFESNFDHFMSHLDPLSF
jgi:hypothetical protein